MPRSRVFYGKEQVIDAAFRIAENEGGEMLSARRLGKEMGVSFATMYNYVPNIWELKKEVVLRGMHLLYQRIYQRLQQETNNRLTLAEGCALIAAEVLHFAQEHPKLYQMIFIKEVHEFRRDLEVAPFYDLFLRLFPQNKEKAKARENHMALKMLNDVMNGLIADMLSKDSSSTEAQYVHYIEYFIQKMILS